MGGRGDARGDNYILSHASRGCPSKAEARKGRKYLLLLISRRGGRDSNIEESLMGAVQ